MQWLRQSRPLHGVVEQVRRQKTQTNLSAEDLLHQLGFERVVRRPPGGAVGGRGA